MRTARGDHGRGSAACRGPGRGNSAAATTLLVLLAACQAILSHGQPDFTKKLDFSGSELEAAEAGSAGREKLKLAVVIFRDAARTPLSPKYLDKSVNWNHCRLDNTTLPAVKLMTPEGAPLPRVALQHLQNQRRKARPGAHDANLPGGCPTGAITLAGVKQAAELGKWLKRRYLGGRLGSPEEVHKLLGAYASQHNRSVTMLQGVLQGLLPEQLHSQPTPVTVRHPSKEHMFANLVACKGLATLYQKAEKELKAAESHEADNNKEAAASIRTYVKLPPEDATGWLSWKKLLDATMCMEAHGLPRVEGLTDSVYRMIDKEATQRAAHVLGPTCEGSGLCALSLRLSIGLLLSDILAAMKAAADCKAGAPCKSQPRLLLYSAQETTLFPLLSVLGHPAADQWPPFASSLVLELVEASDGKGGTTHSVRALYNQRPLKLSKGSGTPRERAASAALAALTAGAATGEGAKPSELPKPTPLDEFEWEVLGPYMLPDESVFRVMCASAGAQMLEEPEARPNRLLHGQ